MPLFGKKKPDPLSSRARELSAEIAALEQQIKKLDAQVQQGGQSQPRLRSTAMPQGSTITRTHPAASPRPEPVFEEVDQERLKTRTETVPAPGLYNELGVRKYDFPALLRRIKNFFNGPATTNPKLVSYLAAGGVQGLRPMRYEKRVARNRFLFLAAGLFALMTGLLWWYFHNR